jgi:hypothetical protein
MQKRYLLVGGGIVGLALAAAVALILVIGLSFLLFGNQGTEMPFIDSFLGGSQQRDLGVGSDPALFSAMLAEEDVTLTDPVEEYCLTCDITYANSAPMEVSLTSEELTSYMQATNDEKGPMKNIQILLGDDDMMEASAVVDLSDYGYEFSGPVYAKGRIQKASDRTISIDLAEASSGPVPVPAEYLQQGEMGLENKINAQLAKMPGLRIDTLEVEDGELRFAGDFPKTISAD